MVGLKGDICSHVQCLSIWKCRLGIPKLGIDIEITKLCVETR